MSYRYFIKLAYEGSRYSGWQIQPNALSVQQLLESGLKAIAGTNDGITGCGRTDTGVHAAEFFAHFDHEKAFTNENLSEMTYRLNGFLPNDIVVFEILPVFPESNARFSALWREYEYLIIRQKDPFYFEKALLANGNLDIETMNQCSLVLLGKHDFQCFSKTRTQVSNYLCNVISAHWEAQGHFLKFTIRADRFLRNMVRAIVGTMLDIGKNKISPEQFIGIIESRNRSEAGYSVPAKGLALKKVAYPKGVFSQVPVYFQSAATKQ